MLFAAHRLGFPAEITLATDWLRVFANEVERAVEVIDVVQIVKTGRDDSPRK